MVDEIVNPVVDDAPGWELPLLLLGGFRVLVDRLHAELARRGHPEARPVHGFALQAIGTGVTATELGRRLGVSKQAAGKTVDRLERLGYVVREDDRGDARRKLVRRTGRGLDMLVQSAAIFDDLRAEWVRELGRDRVGEIESALRVVAPRGLRVDFAGWFGT